MIYFYSPKPETPSGGVWLIHRLAKLLCDTGIPARVYTPTPFPVYWDANPIPQEIIVNQIRLGQDDIFVVPEVMWPAVQVQGVRNILFVQNYVWLDKAMYFSHPNEVMVCSRFLANHMQRVFDARLTGKVTPFLDEGVWKVTPKEKDRVLVMARRTQVWRKVVDLLLANGFTPDVVTEPLTQRQLSERFSQCEYYVHLVYPEGFPMICLEAMRSGTLVVGTTGGGGNEFMEHDYSAWVVQDPETGQYFREDEFVDRVIEGLLALRGDEERRNRIQTAAHEWSLRYTAQATTLELKKIFG